VFLRNNRGNENNWITIHLVGTESNRDGIGAIVTVDAGGKKQVALRRSTTGYLSQNDPRLHFGLADSKQVESIEVKWPSGIIQLKEKIQINQIITIREQ